MSDAAKICSLPRMLNWFLEFLQLPHCHESLEWLSVILIKCQQSLKIKFLWIDLMAKLLQSLKIKFLWIDLMAKLRPSLKIKSVWINLMANLLQFLEIKFLRIDMPALVKFQVIRILLQDHVRSLD